jgi:hypothetical protein
MCWGSRCLWGLFVCGVCSLIAGRSYAVGPGFARHITIVPVQGEQAYLMGMAFLGLPLMLFAQCYAQYEEKWAYRYEWLLAPGAVAAGVGVFWCSWIFLVQ